MIDTYFGDFYRTNLLSLTIRTNVSNLFIFCIDYFSFTYLKNFKEYLFNFYIKEAQFYFEDQLSVHYLSHS